MPRVSLGHSLGGVNVEEALVASASGDGRRQMLQQMAGAPLSLHAQTDGAPRVGSKQGLLPFIPMVSHWQDCRLTCLLLLPEPYVLASMTNQSIPPS